MRVVRQAGSLTWLCVLATLAVAAIATIAQAAAGAGAGAALLRATVHSDGVDPTVGPLDLASATLQQQATMFELSLATRGTWDPGMLSAKGGRMLCVTLTRESRPQARLCVASRNGKTVLLRSALDRAGDTVGPATPIPAVVGRPDARSVQASFTPLDAGLPLGPFGWRVDARWAGAPGCQSPAGCSDTIPDSGLIASRARVLADPWCFGAAARDRLHPCHNPRLARVAVPSPDDALITPNAPCYLIALIDLVRPCGFGAAKPQARSTMALVGDSHAGHWRGALEVVAQARHWRGVSLTRSSCPLNTAREVFPSPALTSACRRWNREIRRWFRRHPEVRTVFVSEDAHAGFAGSAVAGYRAAWRSLPRSVKHIFVLRDTPESTAAQAGCVRRLLRTYRPIGSRCGRPRGRSLVRDPAVAAARAHADPRVRLIDLVSYMCSRRTCPAVVGGVLVRKDGSHLTRQFSTTLGPYALRAIERYLIH